MKLIGHAFLSGRIDFVRELNPWAFQRIDQGMRQSQRDRILVDPTQAQVELHPAPLNEGEAPEWMDSLERILRSCDKFYLQFKSEVLRFRFAQLDAGKDRQFVTIGTQEEFDQYTQQHWQQIKYFYAERRLGAFCFDFNTLITNRINSKVDSSPMELELRFDQNHSDGKPRIVIDATGSSAPLEIIEWRGTVKEGENGRFAPKNKHMQVSVRNVNRPFTMLHEDRKEFGSHAYTLAGEKMEQLLERVTTRRMKERAAMAAEESVEEA